MEYYKPCMKGHYLSTTTSYHRHELDSLLPEVTVSLMLEDPAGPCRSILEKKGSFGDLLYDLLEQSIPMHRISRIIEVGGGYGYLMRDLLKRNGRLKATMLDLSPYLLEMQRQALDGFDARFICCDFLEEGGTADSVLPHMDLAILNEVVGDLPTACCIPASALSCSHPDDALISEVRRIFCSYHLTPPLGERFNFNLGAVQAVEKLCSASVPYIYISEHSCQARVPAALSGLLQISSPGEPERIRLRGHDEYTVRFSDLECVASSMGYDAMRGSYLDFIRPVIEGEVAFILRLGPSKVDRYEIISQFVEDLAKYEFLVLSG